MFNECVMIVEISSLFISVLSLVLIPIQQIYIPT
jgi:hypothetical protein